jgi:TetR/AcrR family transcriptional regulator, transcriptional repressor of aconitase
MGMAERRRQGIATRTRFLSAAADEIAIHGYAGASLSGIAARAGVPKTALRYHYPTKADFARDIVAHQYARWGQVQEAVMAQGFTGVRLLYALVLTATRQSAESSHARATIVIEMQSGFLDFALPHPRYDWYETAERTIAEAQRDGEIPADLDAREGSYVLLDPAFGAYLRHPTFDADEMIACLRPTWEASLSMMGVPHPEACLELIQPAQIGPPPPLPAWDSA